MVNTENASNGRTILTLEITPEGKPRVCWDGKPIPLAVKNGGGSYAGIFVNPRVADEVVQTGSHDNNEVLFVCERGDGAGNNYDEARGKVYSELPEVLPDTPPDNLNGGFNLPPNEAVFEASVSLGPNSSSNRMPLPSYYIAVWRKMTGQPWSPPAVRRFYAFHPAAGPVGYSLPLGACPSSRMTTKP